MKNQMKKIFTKSNEYRERIHHLIPGGAHTYSKGDDQFPLLSPAAITHGKGSHCWDVDGNEFIDMTMGLTSVSLGHAYEPILDAVRAQLEKGVNFTRPSTIEGEMAEKFLSLVPQHDMIKYAKNGSTATTAAIKLARAFTGRKLVARPVDHPFYSYDDWFIGTTECDFGIPDEIKSLTVTFKADSLNALENLFNQYPNEIACIISEPEKWKELELDYYQKAIDLVHKHGALWIMDEMITGFKTDFPGAIKKYNATPDMATWGKGIANGFSFCALTGIKEVMEFGGIKRFGEKRVFLISTTHGGETHAIAAALATIKVFEENPVVQHNKTIGLQYMDGIKEIVKSFGLQDYINLAGFSWNSFINCMNRTGEPDLALKTLLLQEMINSGILFQGLFSPCYSHNQNDVERILAAFNDACNIYLKALDGKVSDYLVGEPIKPVFRKYN
jgi:glutamate-1-semialdehyde aminotransferase